MHKEGKQTNLVTEGRSGIEAAFAAAGITELASNTEDARLVSTLRRSKFGLEIEHNWVFVDDANFGVINEIVENEETSIEEIRDVVSSRRSFIVAWRRKALIKDSGTIRGVLEWQAGRGSNSQQRQARASGKAS